MKNCRRLCGILFCSMLASSLIVGSCVRANITPVCYLPPEYYTCIPVVPDDLLNAYFHINYGDRVLAAQQYNNAVFVFKGIMVVEGMCLLSEKNILEVSTIRCVAAESGAVEKLKTGDIVDIVGINKGELPGAVNWLLFAACYFVPSGMVELPAAGSGVWTPTY